MGKEQPASYYDAIYKKSAEYDKPWHESRYLKVWQRMVQRFDKDLMVIDLGCGVGQTAQFMFIDCKIHNYIGVDFSKNAIDLARKKREQGDSMGSLFGFCNMDLFEWVSGLDMEGKNPLQFQFFCSETLEHISDDTGLLRLLSERFPGSRIAISVPTFNDPSHVRVFKSVTEAKDRYKSFIEVDDSSQIGPWIILQGKLAKQL